MMSRALLLRTPPGPIAMVWARGRARGDGGRGYGSDSRGWEARQLQKHTEEEGQDRGNCHPEVRGTCVGPAAFGGRGR